MQFLVSDDFDADYIEITSYQANLLIDAFSKELSYWSYRTEKYRVKTGNKPTLEQLTTLDRMERKCKFWAKSVQDLKNGISHCNRRSHRDSE